MSFRLSQTDPDVWMCPAIKPGQEDYYKYVLVCGDDILALLHVHQVIMDHVQRHFKFKGKKVEPREICLAAKLKIFL